MIKVVGIDPGLAGTGIGVIEGDGRQVSGYAFGVIKTCRNTSLSFRLDVIYTKALEFLSAQMPHLIVLEDIFSLNKYPGSGIQLGKVTGVLLLAAHKTGAAIEEISVREAKKVVSGTGKADKYQLEKAVRTYLDHQEKIRPFHASDALALALAGFFRWGRAL